MWHVYTSLVLISAFFAVQGCPTNDWVMFADTCYLLNDTKVTWFTAVQECVHLGGWLADVVSQAEESFLKTTIRHKHATHNPQTIGYWISANDLAREGTWVWGFPSDTKVTYSDWFPGEPNNSWYSHEAEDCVALWGHDNHGYQWNDQPCENLDYFICKTENGPVVG